MLKAEKEFQQQLLNQGNNPSPINNNNGSTVDRQNSGSPLHKEPIQLSPLPNPGGKSPSSAVIKPTLLTLGGQSDQPNNHQMSLLRVPVKAAGADKDPILETGTIDDTLKKRRLGSSSYNTLNGTNTNEETKTLNSLNSSNRQPRVNLAWSRKGEGDPAEFLAGSNLSAIQKRAFSQHLKKIMNNLNVSAPSNRPNFDFELNSLLKVNRFFPCLLDRQRVLLF